MELSKNKKKDKGKEKIKEVTIGELSKAVEFNAVGFGNAVYKRLQTLSNKKYLSDITLVVGKDKIPAHKIVLCAWSDTFNSMLLGNSEWKGYLFFFIFNFLFFFNYF